MEEERQDIDVLDCDVYTYNLTHGEDEEEEQEEYNPYHIYKNPFYHLLYKDFHHQFR